MNDDQRRNRLKERILNEMVIKDPESWELAKEIYSQHYGHFKEGITCWDIYTRIREIKDE